ncbi:MAG: archease [Nanoarchaeota archaeon]|nr:archease [Nanoarchaeota archaeon]
MKKQKFEFFEHTADIKFRAYGKNLEEAFENSASAFSFHVSRGGKIKSNKIKEINLEGADLEALFYGFLDELIYLLDAEGFIVVKAKLSIDENKLKGKLYGDEVKKYKDLDHVKAATYAEMYLKKVKTGWEVQAVLDV